MDRSKLRVTAALIGWCGAGLTFVAAAEDYVVDTSAAPCLRVRSQASTESPPFGCLAPGVHVEVQQSVPYWREITAGDGTHGWVAKKFIKLVGTPAPADPAEALPSNAFLEMHFIDVGQGDAIWIHTYDDNIDGNGRFEGFNIVIDGGPYSADRDNPVLAYLESIGHHGGDIEALMVSHPHTDHFRGAETISRHFEIQNYYDPGYPSTLSSYTAFLTAMRGTPGQPGRAKHVHLGAGQFGQINWGSEIKVDVLYAWPGDAPDLGNGNTEVNNSSIVLRVQYGAHTFLFMGDAEGKDRDDDPSTPRYVEARLLADHPSRLKSTLLKVSHHGSETSSTLPFIAAVDPAIVIVESGRKDFNGTFLPDLSTLQRYCAHNRDVKIFRTDQGDEHATEERDAVDGDDIVIRSNGRDPPIITGRNGIAPIAYDCR